VRAWGKLLGYGARGRRIKAMRKLLGYGATRRITQPTSWMFIFLAAGQVHAESALPLHSATEYLSADLKAEQSDEMRNRGMLWVDQGLALWDAPAGGSGKSCASCHGAPQSMKGVAARYPAVESGSGRLFNLEARINACRVNHQGAGELAAESNELLGLTAMIARQSLGMAVKVATEGAARPFFEAGRTFWNERQGQMNLSCAQCHDASVGRKLRGDTISSGIGTGYPVYRLEWQGMGSLHRRLKACQLGVRAVQFPAGSDEYLALELYLAARAQGHEIETPALRR
jgi:L-cysteine S-thiosulfotransferase